MNRKPSRRKDVQHFPGTWVYDTRISDAIRYLSVGRLVRLLWQREGSLGAGSYLLTAFHEGRSWPVMQRDSQASCVPLPRYIVVRKRSEQCQAGSYRLGTESDP